MARSGIYVNGKEVVARYFGNKLVWQKSREKILTTMRYDTPLSRSYDAYARDRSHAVELVYYLETSVTDDLEFDITRVAIGNNSWNASKYSVLIRSGYGKEKRVTTRITFTNSVDMYSFINFTKSNPAGKITVYQEKR